MYDVLVVDDEWWIRKGIIKMIDKDNLKISQFYEADRTSIALQTFKERKPNIIISDVKLPEEDGCTLCEKIYELEPSTKIIMISAFRDFEYAKRSLSYKAVDYLLKPVDKTKLNETISKAIAEAKLGSGEKAYVNSYDGEFSHQGVENIIDEVKNLIKSDYREQFTLTDLANKYYMSESYFSYAFKKHTGSTLINYIMDVRIERAKELIVYTDYQIGEIAEKVGYNDQQYFSKIFKRKTGINPTQYRIKMKRELERK